MDYLIAFADETDASKVAHDLLPFFEAVVKEVAKHRPEKGDSWKTMDQDKLEVILVGAWNDLWFDEPNLANQLVDVGGLCAMLFSRVCAELRRDE